MKYTEQQRHVHNLVVAALAEAIRPDNLVKHATQLMLEENPDGEHPDCEYNEHPTVEAIVAASNILAGIRDGLVFVEYPSKLRQIVLKEKI